MHDGRPGKCVAGCGVERDSVESVCAGVVGTSHVHTIRKCLNEQLTAQVLLELELCPDISLAAEIAATIWHRARDIAIDFHDRLYLISPPHQARQLYQHRFGIETN